MGKSRCIQAGEKAPDFSLSDHNEKEFRLSNFKGKRVLLSFHPLAWTGVCAKQMKSLEKHWKDFEKLNVVAVGVNVDSVPSKKAWADSLDIKHVRFLSDFWPHGNVAKQYGIFREKEGFSERANIIVGEDQTIEYVQLYDLPQLPDIQEIIDVITTMSDE